jgi:hypothetical protein
MNLSSSGLGRTRESGVPIVLRLLPHVHHPPARVAVPWGGDDARALDARGYRVTVFAEAAPAVPGIAASAASFLDAPDGEYDLVCETGGFSDLGPDHRAGYAAAAARALRPGGILFGTFPADDTGALLTLFGARFDAVRLEPSAFGGARLEAVFVRR